MSSLFSGFVFLLLLPVFVCGVPAHAHDISIVKAELQPEGSVSDRFSANRKDTRESSTTDPKLYGYIFRIMISDTQSYLTPPPTMSSGCKLARPFSGNRSGEWLAFHYTCAQPLDDTDYLTLVWQKSGTHLTARWSGGDYSSAVFLRQDNRIVVPLSELSATGGSKVKKARKYFVLGAEHILVGYDHLLFVLGIVLLISFSWALIKTITAFTLGHSVTLGLASFQVVVLPLPPVEACIALSIVILAWEVIRRNRGRPGLSVRFPWLVASGFGLLHGLGFASALDALGVALGDLPLALLFFNLGVEAGQLLFIGALYAAGITSRWLWSLTVRQPVSRNLWSTPFAYLMGTLAMYWTLERALTATG